MLCTTLIFATNVHLLIFGDFMRTFAAVPLPPLYGRYQRWWELLGYPAFAAMVVVFYLMVNKPQL